MKTTITKLSTRLYQVIMIVAMFFGFLTKASAQCSVVSTNGYVVSINISPTDIVPNRTTNCTNGYNFNYRLNYNITFSGVNIPSSLWTLQGNVLASGYGPNFFDLPNNGGSGTTVSTGNSYTSRTDCNSATVASFNPSIQIEIQGPGISYRTISCPIVALPVEFASLSGTKAEEGIMIKWATANEKNNNYFTIERSNDVATWVALDNINGAGNSHHLAEYSYLDQNPSNGVNYYRVKQTDNNGNWSYSRIITVNNTNSAIETTVYPNPATGSSVNLKVISASQEPLEVEVFNTMGQKLESYSILAESGLANYTIALPGSGNMFLVNVIQNNTVIGKHQVLVR